MTEERKHVFNANVNVDIYTAGCDHYTVETVATYGPVMVQVTIPADGYSDVEQVKSQVSELLHSLTKGVCWSKDEADAYAKAYW